MRTRKTLLTAEELLRLSASAADRRYELVKGELFEMPPAGARHGDVAMEIGALLRSYVKANQLGRVFAAETGFILQRSPDTVRAPDASFVSNDSLPPGGLPAGFMEIAPDLAVEVRSPGDTEREVGEKVADWLDAGTRLVWLVDPATRSVIVHQSQQDSWRLDEGDTLEGEPVLPGFTCPVVELFS